MPKLIRLVVASLALMLAALLPGMASAQTVDEIISRGKLIVAIDTTTPPYGFLDSATFVVAFLTFFISTVIFNNDRVSLVVGLIMTFVVVAALARRLLPLSLEEPA